MIKDGEELSGVDAYISRIGEEGDGYDGFHGPIYSAVCRSSIDNGLRRDAMTRRRSCVVPAILAAPCRDGRNTRRYAKDCYLDQRIADAREFMGLAVKQKAERVKAVTGRVEEIVASFTGETDASEFERVYKMISSIKMQPIKRKAIVDKLVKLTGITAAKVNKAIDDYAEIAANAAATKKENAKRNKETANVIAGNVKPRLDVMKDDFGDMVEVDARRA